LRLLFNLLAAGAAGAKRIEPVDEESQAEARSGSALPFLRRSGGRTCDATPKFGEVLGYKGGREQLHTDGGREWMSASETGINLCAILALRRLFASYEPALTLGVNAPTALRFQYEIRTGMQARACASLEKG